MRVLDDNGNELNLFDSVIETTRQGLVAGFQQEASPRMLIRLSEVLMAQTESLLEQVRQQRQPAIACKKGCFWCCHAYVSVTPLEVLALVEYVRANFTPEEIEALRARTAVVAARRAGLAWKQQEELRTLCPLLVNGACSVYPARPLVCRGHTSKDAEVCRRNIEAEGEPPKPVEFYRLFKEITMSVRVGLEQGLAKTPFQDDDLELVAALHVALNEPDSTARWLAGERVFAGDTLERGFGNPETVTRQSGSQV